MDFTVYRYRTGEIIRSGTCSPADFKLQTGGDRALAVLPVGSDDRLHMIVKRHVVDKPAPAAPDPMISIRAERDRLLSASDWTQLPDAPVDQAAWAAYRQALRDFTKTVDPANPVWPEQPT
ncbi:MAG: tail fiber assembly protein [Mesorhizobium sp.]